MKRFRRKLVRPVSPLAVTAKAVPIIAPGVTQIVNSPTSLTINASEHALMATHR